MKKLILAVVVFCMIAVPAMADSWTMSFVADAGVDHIVIHHKAISDPVPDAQAFIDAGGFTAIQIGNVSPQSFVIEYPEGIQYGLYAEAFASDGSSSVFSKKMPDGTNSATVWTAASEGVASPAHYEVVISGDDTPKITDADLQKE